MWKNTAGTPFWRNGHWSLRLKSCERLLSRTFLIVRPKGAFAWSITWASEALRLWPSRLNALWFDSADWTGNPRKTWAAPLRNLLVAADHVHVEHRDDPIQRHWRPLDECP